MSLSKALATGPLFLLPLLFLATLATFSPGARAQAPAAAVDGTRPRS